MRYVNIKMLICSRFFSRGYEDAPWITNIRHAQNMYPQTAALLPGGENNNSKGMKSSSSSIFISRAPYVLRIELGALYTLIHSILTITLKSRFYHSHISSKRRSQYLNPESEYSLVLNHLSHGLRWGPLRERIPQALRFARNSKLYYYSKILLVAIISAELI